MAKQNNKKTENISISNDKNEFKRLLKIILIVSAIFIVFYGITILVTKQEKNTIKNENKTSEKAQIQYDNIMIGTMLNHGGEYYVLIENSDDIRLTEYNSLIENIKNVEDSTTIYKANLTDSFNKPYIGKEEKYYVNDISEFKVKETTLVKIKDGKIEAAFDNYNAIKNKLKELS